MMDDTVNITVDVYAKLFLLYVYLDYLFYT